MLRKLLLVFILCLPLLAFKKKKQKVPLIATGEKIDYRQTDAPLPPVRLIKLNGEVITNKTLAGNGNLIVMMFNPTCEHCENMTIELGKNVKLFHQTKVVLVAGSMMRPYVDDFVSVTKADAYPVLQLGIDSSKIIDNLYSYFALPQLNIYNKERKLIKMFSGLETIDSLRPYID